MRGFEKYLILYQPAEDAIVVERVIHAAEDYQRILQR